MKRMPPLFLPVDMQLEFKQEIEQAKNNDALLRDEVMHALLRQEAEELEKVAAAKAVSAAKNKRRKNKKKGGLLSTTEPSTQGAPVEVKGRKDDFTTHSQGEWETFGDEDVSIFEKDDKGEPRDMYAGVDVLFKKASSQAYIPTHQQHLPPERLAAADMALENTRRASRAIQAGPLGIFGDLNLSAESTELVASDESDAAPQFFAPTVHVTVPLTQTGKTRKTIPLPPPAAKASQTPAAQQDRAALKPWDPGGDVAQQRRNTILGREPPVVCNVKHHQQQDVSGSFKVCASEFSSSHHLIRSLSAYAYLEWNVYSA